MRYWEVCESVIGPLTLISDEEAIISIEFGEKEPSDAIRHQNHVIVKTAFQLTEYFSGKRKTFDIQLKPEGTEFQKKVWDALQTIPYGQTQSYGAIAKQIGNPKAGRAVGMANNRNPIPIIIPCHRVIGKDGSLVGYGGGLDIKVKLLELEGIKNNWKNY